MEQFPKLKMNNLNYDNNYISDILQYIETNISEDLGTDILSGIGCVSQDKLYYDFLDLTRTSCNGL